MALTRSLAAVAALAFAQHVQAWNPVLPTCLSPFKPFVYSGCFDDTSGETLEWRTLLDQTNMTVESCQAYCKGNEYRYAGLENGNVCYCGETVNSNIQLPDSYCNATCAGNSSESCGQFNVIEIFSDTTFPKVNESTIADYVSIGCWSDNPDNKRTLYHQITSLASDDTAGCLNGCKDLGFPYAGLEYGGECWCGVVLANNATQIADSSCNMNCPNTNEICGGSNALSLYVAYDMESLEPCGYTTTSSSVPVISTTSSSSSSATSPVTPTTSSTTVKVTPTTTSTSCPVSPKTTTTTKPTTAPPATTSKTTTSSAPLCTETIWTPSPCEYGCGSWCNKNIPEWDEGTGCGSGYAACKIQVSACFKNAGFPGVIDCWSYAEWCSSISSYCSSTCKNGVKGSCSKTDCIGRSPPKGGKPPTSTTTVVPCKPTTTSMPAPPKTTTSSKTSCVPSPTPICTQPSNPWYGYGPGKPVGGIDMPVLTCNDIKSDWQNNPFKLYTDSNSSKCGSYPRPSVPNACKDACKAQYDNCNSGYAQGCKSYWKKRNFFEYTATGENSPEKRGLSWWGGNIFGGDSYQSATNKCQQQYQDCLNANKNPNYGGKCSSFGSGW